MKDFFIIAAIALLLINALLLFIVFRVKKIRALIAAFEVKSQSYILLITGMAFILLAVFFTLFVYKDIIPENASLHGKLVEEVFFVTLGFTGTVFLITQFLLFYLPFRYRAKEGRKPFYITNNFKLEFIWTIVPLLTFVFLFIWAQIIWEKIHSPLTNALEIEIVAEQFNWFVRYPGKDGKLGKFHIQLINQENDLGIDFTDKNSLDDFMPFQLHIPKNHAVKIRLRSKDVIHSIDIPHMKVKMDAVPGIFTTATFIATVTTKQMRKIKNDPEFNYEMACAELCGRMHFAMLMIIVVDEEEEFEKWYESQVPWIKEHPGYLNIIKKSAKTEIF